MTDKDTAAQSKPKPKRTPRKSPEKVLAARHDGADAEQVLKVRVEDGLVVYLVDFGIAGTKKYKVPLSEFKEKAPFFQPKG